MKGFGFKASKKLLAFLLFLSPVLSCATIRDAIRPPTATATATATATHTPTNIPTPTRIPLAERDLKGIALNTSDLPDGFTEIDYPDLEGYFRQTGQEDSIFLEDLKNGLGCFFSSKADGIYFNLIFVYSDSASAKRVYTESANSLIEGQELDIPLIGEESYATMQTMDSYGTTSLVYGIIWRFQEAVFVLIHDGEEDIGAEEMVRLAEIVQSRVEEA
jgi:hypothetical protein